MISMNKARTVTVSILILFLLTDCQQNATGTEDPDPGKTYYGVHFERGTDVGDDDSYLEAGYPKPAYWSNGVNIMVWHDDPETQEEWYRSWAESSSALGIKGVQVNIYGCPKSLIQSGELPPMDVLARRNWATGQPGFLQDILHMRDVIADLVSKGHIEFIVLRPWQEAGAGYSFECGFTPDTYRETIEWMADEIYGNLPVRAVVSHWNKITNIERTIPNLEDSSIEVYPGISIYMPSWPHRDPPDGGDMHLAEQNLDFASRAREATGLRTWIVEFSVFADNREDPDTGWEATALREPSVIPEFFEHYRAMRENGHIAGITWYNANFSFAGGPIDGRWDADHTHPEVRDWWLSEVTRENGYVLD